jgi:hypothetical protein
VRLYTATGVRGSTERWPVPDTTGITIPPQCRATSASAFGRHEMTDPVAAATPGRSYATDLSRRANAHRHGVALRTRRSVSAVARSSACPATGDVGYAEPVSVRDGRAHCRGLPRLAGLLHRRSQRMAHIKRTAAGTWQANGRDPAGRKRAKNSNASATPSGSSPSSKPSRTAASTSKSTQQGRAPTTLDLYTHHQRDLDKRVGDRFADFRRLPTRTMRRGRRCQRRECG